MYSVVLLQHPEGVQIFVGDRTVLLELYESGVGDDGNTRTRPPSRYICASPCAARLTPAHRISSQGVRPPSRCRVGPGGHTPRPAMAKRK